MAETPTGSLIVLDFDRDNILLGVEVLDASSVMSPAFVAGAERTDG